MLMHLCTSRLANRALTENMNERALTVEQEEVRLNRQALEWSSLSGLGCLPTIVALADANATQLIGSDLACSEVHEMYLCPPASGGLATSCCRAHESRLKPFWLDAYLQIRRSVMWMRIVE